MEKVVISALPSAAFWRGQRVFLTGHTGFKGGWAALWLRALGADVQGYALPPPDGGPTLFDALHLGAQTSSQFGDIRDLGAMRECFEAFDPSIVIHMAAQPLVRAAYADPAGTYATNVIGTVNVLELARASRARATLVVTTDKCYENREQIWPYREIDRLGGRDPYSSSKACAELVTQSYWWSYFGAGSDRALASVRAGNVVGGGDWSCDRLVPDLVRAFGDDRAAVLRRPGSIRPWQHVLEPICGYLLAIEWLCRHPAATPPAWNFGPDDASNVSVRRVAGLLAEQWGAGARIEERPEQDAPHEAGVLTIDSTKARRELQWRPRWDLKTTMRKVAQWHRAHGDGEDMVAITQAQLADYTASAETLIDA